MRNAKENDVNEMRQATRARRIVTLAQAAFSWPPAGGACAASCQGCGAMRENGGAIFSRGTACRARRKNLALSGHLSRSRVQGPTVVAHGAMDGA